MYRGFVYASDAVPTLYATWQDRAVRGRSTLLHNLSRLPLRSRAMLSAISGLRKAWPGDDSALPQFAPAALRDAACKIPGRKVVIVFSNGPDDAPAWWPPTMSAPWPRTKAFLST